MQHVGKNGLVTLILYVLRKNNERNKANCNNEILEEGKLGLAKGKPITDSEYFIFPYAQM